MVKMQKVILVIGITILFISISIASAGSLPEKIATSNEYRLFIGLKGHLDIWYNGTQTEEPLIPRGDIRPIEIEVTYFVTKGIFGSYFLHLFRVRQAFISLEILEKPEWCGATIQTDTIAYTLAEKPNTKRIILSVQLSEDAPAFEPFNITVKASIDTKHGRFGIISLIGGVEKTVNISLIGAYNPLIMLYLPNGSEIKTYPGNVSILPIVFKNLGNGKTIIETEIIEKPDDWIVLMQKEIIVEVGESVEEPIYIIPANFIGETTIRLAFTPKYAYEPSITGETLYLSIKVICQPR